MSINIRKWVNGTLTPEELSQFKSRPEYDSLEAIDKAVDGLKAPEFAEEEMLQDILKEGKGNPKPNNSKPKTIHLSTWWRYAAAACVLLLASWFFWPSNSNMVTYELAKGEKKAGELPDGSTFVLNAESKLWYNPDDWQGERKLKLNGEAFFEVKKGNQFIVNTNHGSVKVLGTAFNVRVRKNKLEVSCNSGKVAVVSRKGVVLKELNPNEVVRVADDRIIAEWTLPEGNRSSWQDGITRLTNVPLKVILAELERQFDIEIDAGNVDVKEKFTVRFSNTNLEKALQTTSKVFGVQYEEKGEGNLVLTK